MRTFNFFAVLALFLFSSFTTTSSGFSNSNPKAGDVSHSDETYVEESYFALCNGDLVYVPELTTHLDIHRLQNGNKFMVHGKVTQTGTGQSVYTGETFTINLEDQFHNKTPFAKGSEVYKQRSIGTITGAQSSRDNFFTNSRIIMNAKGELTSYEYEHTTECQ